MRLFLSLSLASLSALTTGIEGVHPLLLRLLLAQWRKGQRHTLMPSSNCLFCFLIRRISMRGLTTGLLAADSLTVDTIKLVEWQGMAQAKKEALLVMNISRPHQRYSLFFSQLSVSVIVVSTCLYSLRFIVRMSNGKQIHRTK